jgi:DNA-binding NarL/FixJ family response regulator
MVTKVLSQGLRGDVMAQKILIVEDERIVAEHIQKSLETFGYTVLGIVSTAEQAIDAAKNADVVLMDIVLDGETNGIKAAEAIHTQHNVPVVFLTAYAGENIIARAKLAEPYGYLVKPFENRELHATIEMALYRHEMEKKLEESKKELEQKIEERSWRVEILLNTRQKLQGETNWEKGLKIIVECMKALKCERCGIFVVNPVKKTLDYSLGTGDNLPEGVSVSLSNTHYIGVKCVLEKRTIHITSYTPRMGTRIFSKSDSFVWVPIIFQNEAFAAIVADSTVKKTPITDQDVKDLEILAGMWGGFIDRTRTIIEPVPEKMLQTEFKHWLDPKKGYIVLEKEPKKSFQIFMDLVTHGIPGFIVTREHPENLKQKYKLLRTPVLWLSRSDAENTISPDSFSKLIYLIKDFTKKSEESVILLEGLEYLIAQIGFEIVLTYLHELKDTIVMNNSRVIIPFHKETIPDREFSMLEKEFVLIGEE